MVGIYRITNPKGHIYIGQSSNIEKRFNQYRSLFCNTLRRPDRKVKGNSLIYII